MASVTKGWYKMTEETPKFSIDDQLRGLIEQLSAYIETYHGGEVEFVDFDGKILTVKLGGACLGCPLSPVTVKGWVENALKAAHAELAERADRLRALAGELTLAE